MVEFKEVLVKKRYVSILGKEYPLEDWAKWVAVDSDGDIYQYLNKPTRGESFWDDSDCNEDCRTQCVALYVADYGEVVQDWEELLFEVKV